ncbi:MAG: GNAT family N-acetyltransferase [Dyadobacter sp.]|uniref:GNAT family N-acetyltransferase n=1 Tax=Dyadobacter sp. TaxID=1914288 RepID=UPI003267689E
MISIIPFEQQFQDQLVSLILNIQQLEFNVPITAEDQPDLFIIDDFYRKDGGEFWVAVSEGKVVGSIAVIKIGNNAGVIRKMFVRKEFRGKEWGIAQRLFDSLILYCHANAIDAVYLGTIDRLQAAIRFYEKNGFSTIEKRALPTDFPIMSVDNVFCKLSIQQG